MNNDYKGSSWSERFSWIVTIAAMVLVAILSIGLLCALFIQPQEEKKEDTEQTAISEQAAVIDSEGNAMDGDTVYPMPAKMSFNEQTFAQVSEPSGSATVTSDESVDVRIQAYVTPDDAVNKEVDFSVAWGNAPTHGSEDVTDYLTVTPDSDGSTMATVSCKKSFGDDTIIITVTTREGGYTATCTVTFTGIASGIEITSSTATKEINVRPRRILRTRYRENVHIRYRAYQRFWRRNGRFVCYRYWRIGFSVLWRNAYRGRCFYPFYEYAEERHIFSCE